jgi:hypothetical protein
VIVVPAVLATPGAIDVQSTCTACRYSINDISPIIPVQDVAGN